MRFDYKAERASRITSAHLCVGNFIRLLRLLDIVDKAANHERAEKWYDFDFLKRMGVKAKSRGSFKS